MNPIENWKKIVNETFFSKSWSEIFSVVAKITPVMSQIFSVISSLMKQNFAKYQVTNRFKNDGKRNLLEILFEQV